MTDYQKKQLEKARRLRKENQKFLRNLSTKKNIDASFHQQHEEVFAKTDCLTCANCCRTTSPIFRDVDIERIAAFLGIKAFELTERYLHLDDDSDWVLNSAPCVFLESDNKCSIYNVRPKACREYPHTDRKNMHQVLDLAFRNTLVCPAVAEMVERIKKE